MINNDHQSLWMNSHKPKMASQNLTQPFCNYLLVLKGGILNVHLGKE